MDPNDVTQQRSGLFSLLLVVAVVSVSTGMALGLAEALLRATRRFPTTALHTASAEDWRRIPGVFEPNQELTRLLKRELPHSVRINSLGLRGPDAALHPEGDRLLCIGDSFTFGDFVDDDETLPARLAAHLGSRAEVLNGGVGGTTIVDQYVFLQRMLVLEPDVVLLVYSENDLNDLRLTPPMYLQLARNREFKSGLLNPAYRFIRDTVLFHLVLKRRAVLRAGHTRYSGASPASPDTLADRSRDADLYANSVARLRELLDLNGIGFVFAAYPSRFNVSGDSHVQTIPLVVETLRRVDIEAIDLTATLRESGLPSSGLYLLPYDSHPSPRGYEIAAAAIAPAIRVAFAERAEDKYHSLTGSE